MKRFVDGKRLILVLFGLWCASPSFAGAPDRRNWIFEQLGSSPVPTEREIGRYQVSLGAVNYVDTTSLQVTGQLDLRYFEVRLRGAQRVFLEATPRGVSQRATLDNERSTFGFEIARLYVTPARHYARLGVEGLYFLPNPVWTLRVGLDTGILDSPSSPWALGLHLSVFVDTPGSASVLHLRGQVNRVISEGNSHFWKLGAALGFSQRNSDPQVPGTYESALFSLGPSLEYLGPTGCFRLVVPLRLWLDRNRTATGVRFPIELSPPDVQLSWTLLL